MSQAEVRIIPIAGLPEIAPGANLGDALMDGVAHAGWALADGDVLVVTHKIVAKAEGALVDLRTVTPSTFAARYAERWNKDARQVEVVLQHSARIVRMDHGVLIAETRHGFVCANAGVDLSNVAGEDMACLLPEDPDASAARIMDQARARAGVDLAVVVSDTFGRPWREGLTNVAIGVAGMLPLRSYVGQRDPHGHELRVTALAIADELAAAAELVMGKLDRVPAAVVRGYAYDRAAGDARTLVRRPELDLFR